MFFSSIYGLGLYGSRQLIKNIFSVEYVAGPYLKCTLLKEHKTNMFPEQCDFQIWLTYETSFRLLMVQDQKILLVQDHMPLISCAKMSKKRDEQAYLIIAYCKNQGASETDIEPRCKVTNRSYC